MSYSSFTNEKIKDKFGVEQTLKRGIFDNLPKRTPSNWLLETLSKTRDFALSQGSEKARSEYIIAPVFYELREQSEQQISIFSGRKFDIDKKQQLDGFCDFLVSRSPSQVILESPVMVAVEAKQDKFEKGTTQCIAEMIAARIFNERKGNPQKQIYGCVTTGVGWLFLVLDNNNAFVDTTIFDVTNDLEQILGILWAMSFGEIDIK
jgi:hypothetical protein